MQASKIRERRAKLLLLVQGRSRGLLHHRVFKDRAKARVNHPTMGGISGLLANQGKGHVSIATTLDT